ncbi:MBOAT, membrane-bound O-acyltransferase family-domain-containing protein [Zopfochytrium polystomum]|nr:MBOAT, membrane-bound O-acyltransferase family-domain-containing protein [Zopfochytrium polystomum]
MSVRKRTTNSHSAGVPEPTLSSSDAPLATNLDPATSMSSQTQAPSPQLSPTAPGHPILFPGQRPIESIVAENDELNKSLKEQLQHLAQIRESTAQVMANVQHLYNACLNRVEISEGSKVQVSDFHLTDKGKSAARPVHPRKIFRHRVSRLSALLEIQDIATVYNIFVATLPLLFISLCVQSYYETGRFIDFSLLFHSFQRLDIVAVVWTALFAYALLAYNFKRRDLRTFLRSTPGIAVYALYQSILALSAAYFTLRFKLPPASGFIVMCEQSRLGMKVHSFYREHVKHKTDVERSLSEPGLDDVGFTHYLYFLFCPTLLYRTSYPRTPFVRWSRVISHFMECAFIILYIYILFKRFLFPSIRVPLQSNQDDLKVFLLMTFNSMFPSMVLFVFGFFGFLHCWLNLWAELLQFGDREFYRDWWNSYSFAEYYRKWNGVVYDWLFTYAYLEFVACLESMNFKQHHARMLGAVFVIEVSAIIHEFILACALGYFFPLLLLMYGGPGLIFTHLNRSRSRSRVENIFVWAMLLIGCGLLVTLYAREYYVRQSATRVSDLSDWKYWAEFCTAYSLKDFFKKI